MWLAALFPLMPSVLFILFFLQKRIEDLSDAEEAAMLADESNPGAIKILIGDCFIDVDSTYATTYIEEQKTVSMTLEQGDIQSALPCQLLSWMPPSLPLCLRSNHAESDGCDRRR
jgi:hypothetical protein